MNEGQSPARLNSIRALRGVAVLLVLFSHLMAVERNFFGDRLLTDVWIIGFSGVDIFFVISGFIMVYITKDIQFGLRSSLLFLFARISRIYPLYWIVTLSLTLVWLEFPQFVSSGIQVAPDLLRSFLLFPDVRDPLLPVGWTLIHEMYFYLIFGFLLLFSRKFLLVTLLLFAGVAVAGYVIVGPVFTPVQRIVFSPLTFEFLAGALVAMSVLRWEFSRWWLWMAAGIILFAAGLFYAGFLAADNFWTEWKRALVFAPPSALLVLGCVAMEKSGKSFSRLLTWTGDQSYSLYLTHLLTLSLFGRIWGWFAIPGLVDNVIVLPVLVVLSLIVGQLTYIMLERPLLSGSYLLRKKLAQIRQ